jgi:hypothetical protein
LASGPPSTARNPFRGKGLRIPVALLLDPARTWTLRALAEHTGASQALVSGVLQQLRRDGALPVDAVAHGRRAEVRATPALLLATAARWPTPDRYVWAGTVPDEDVTMGGTEAQSAAGFLALGRPRAYVRSDRDLIRLLARWGGLRGTEDVADWEITVLDIDLPIGLLPPQIAALELGADPRGREELEARAEELLLLGAA